MQWLRPSLFSVLLLFTLLSQHLFAESSTHLPTGRIAKVLPLLMDTNGAVARSPSLFDRDAYQAYLAEHTTNVSGIRFDVCWGAYHARGRKLTVRVEVLGANKTGLPTETILQGTVTPRLFHHWISLTLAGSDYKKLGRLVAWRATLWNGKEKLGEKRSFLWSL